MQSEKMLPAERQAVISLSFIMSLRMIGLFMVLPVFALYAHQLTGATPALIGLGMGIYGLTQALCQIPFGALSDRIGRKPVIAAGLFIFASGSLVAALAHSMTWMIAGRALQGAGAVGSTILAFMADLTRENQRTKAMAISGITIGFSFSVAMLTGPLLTRWMPVNGLFGLAVLLSLSAVLVLCLFAPPSPRPAWHRDTEPELNAFLKLLIHPELSKLNSGIFILHALFTASFIVIPLSLNHFAHLPLNRQWAFYLPALLIALVVSLFCIGRAERHQQIKAFFISGIICLAVAEPLLWAASISNLFAVCGLCVFFTGFTMLEAFLPSLVSRTAPAARKGSAMGIYSCSQFLGIFIGGVLGGWLYGKFGFLGVYLFCLSLALVWLALALRMRPPRYLITHMLRISPTHHPHWQSIAAKLQVIPGMIEVNFIAEDGIVYLKMERNTAKHHDFICLKEQLQSEPL